MVSEPLDATRLEKPLDLNPPRNESVEEDLVKKILDAIYKAKNPMILVDVITARFHCTPQVRQLVDITQFPVSHVFSSPANSVFYYQSWQRNLERNRPYFRGSLQRSYLLSRRSGRHRVQRLCNQHGSNDKRLEYWGLHKKYQARKCG
jgi:hypothetical protein